LLDYFKYWANAGIHSELDDDQKRKVFLTNAMSLFLATVMLLVGLNDIFNTENYLAAYRRAGVLVLMLLIPFLNHNRLYNLSKSIFLFFPSLILLGIPIIIGDFYPGQFIWFQYAGAIFCSVPFLLFDFEKHKLYIALFFIYYLMVTLFIDKLLLYYSEPPEAMRELVTDFTDFKLPPLFVAFFSTSTLLWYNRSNSKYEKKLRSTNQELEETQEELISKNEEYEAINRNLETLVEERTKLIDSKNRQIIDYANINAHKVRGPLARIMGLINVSHFSNDPEELKNLFEKLGPPSAELNMIIGEINKTLEQGEEDDVEEE
jgi:ABC-type multidrug transport system fused ATPase/permease subunit